MDVAQRVARVMQGELDRALAPGLYLVATPIGSLADITLRALATLSGVDGVFAEDTRHSGTLLSHYSIRVPLKAYHEHNGERVRPQILDALSRGERIALISDAGTPLISDPGYKLTRACLEAGHRVISVPGPSAVLCGLTSTGLPTDQFQFAGFLPAKSAARKSRISELARVEVTLVLFEAPGRLAGALSDLAEGLGVRAAAVARELTKVHEEVRSGTLRELAEHYKSERVRGECVIVVGPADQAASEVADAEIVARLEMVLETVSLRNGARDVAAELGVRRARVYDLGLKLREREG